MLRNIEQTAAQSQLHLSNRCDAWHGGRDSPHIATFRYDLGVYEDDDLKSRGTVDGYRIAQDWTVDHELALWDEADALDGDIVRYVEALIRELRACEIVFESAPDLTMAQRVTIVRHVEGHRSLNLAKLTQNAVACMAMMDAPVLMLVDPWPMSDERRSAKGKLKGRGNVRKLLELGFVRMVGSRFLWAWNHEISDTLMAEYSYEELLAARREGKLDKLLKSPLSEEIYGSLPKGLAESVDLPSSDDLTEE